MSKTSAPHGINPSTGKPYKMSAEKRGNISRGRAKALAERTSPDDLRAALQGKDYAALRVLANAAKLSVSAVFRFQQGQTTHLRRSTEQRLRKHLSPAANGDAAAPTEFPLDAIPDRAPKQVRTKAPLAVLNGFGNGHGKHAAQVHAEYDIGTDQMTLVLGKLRLPFRVKM